MSGRRIGGVVCIVLAALFLMSALSSLSAGPGVDDPSGRGASYTVGRFLPSLLFLIIGLKLLQKPKAVE